MTKNINKDEFTFLMNHIVSRFPVVRNYGDTKEYWPINAKPERYLMKNWKRNENVVAPAHYAVRGGHIAYIKARNCHSFSSDFEEYVFDDFNPEDYIVDGKLKLF